MPKVLVTDSSERAALAVIRSLGKRGINIVAADDTSFNAGFLSKYVSQKIIYPSPKKNKRKFIDFILKLVKTENFDLLIPITDFTIVPLLEYEDELKEHVKVAVPPYSISIKTLDKLQTIKIAEKHDIPCPRTFVLEKVSDLEEVAAIIKYPVVIKPRMKVIWLKDKALTLKVTSENYAYGPEDLTSKYLKIIKLHNFQIPSNFFLIQEFARGDGYGVEALIDNSKVRAIFVHKRLREYPITGGSSTLRISVKNEVLENYAVDLLKAMDWSGVAMVEFKLDEQTGRVMLMEVNGRFWGSLPLAINAGVDFPVLLFECLVEKKSFKLPKYFIGQKQKWMLPGDLLWFYASFVNGEKNINYFKKFIQSLIITDDILVADDLAPVIGALRTSINSFRDLLAGHRNIAGEIVSNKN